jgi:hypothetical protein
MHIEQMLAPHGGQMTVLDDEQLTDIVGGLGPLSRVFAEFVSILWDCVKTGIDDVIDAAQEGYEDNRG